MKFETFLYNMCSKRKKFKINLFCLALSVIKYIKMLYLYKKNKFKIVSEIIVKQYQKKEKKIKQNAIKYSTVDLLYASSRYLRIYRIAGYLFNQSEYCLERSVSLTYALNFIGIPSYLVIGKANYHISENFNFHAWVEVNGHPINDSYGVKKQWHQIYHLPKIVKA